MKKYILILFSLLAISQYIKSQDTIPLYRDDIVGRWVEQMRIEGNVETQAMEYPDTYIFRDNGVFHKGEAAEGIIIFNITGRYKIEGDTISILYADYLQDRQRRAEQKELLFKVLSLSDEGLCVAVTDGNRKYKMILKR